MNRISCSGADSPATSTFPMYCGGHLIAMRAQKKESKFRHFHQRTIACSFSYLGPKLTTTRGSTVARGLVLMASRYGLVKQRRSTVSCGIFTYIQYDKDVHGTEDVCEPVHDNYEEKNAPKEIKVIDWLVRKVCILTFSHSL